LIWQSCSNYGRIGTSINSSLKTAGLKPWYLTAVLIPFPRKEFIPFDENGFLFFREFELGNRRYIISFDVARFLDEQKKLKQRIEQVLNWVQQKNQTLAEAKKARNREKLEQEIQTMLKRKRVKKVS